MMNESMTIGTRPKTSPNSAARTVLLVLLACGCVWSAPSAAIAQSQPAAPAASAANSPSAADLETLRTLAQKVQTLARDASLDAKAKQAGAREVLSALAPLTAKYPDAIEFHVVQGYAAVIAANEFEGRQAGAAIVRLGGDRGAEGATKVVLDALREAGWIEAASDTTSVGSQARQPTGTTSESSPAAVEAIRTLSGHSDDVNSAAFSPDGRFIVTASDDKTAIVWDAALGQRLRTLTGHGDEVFSAGFSPDGRFIVTASRDNTAIVWDAASGQRLRTLSEHLHTVYSGAFSPDGRLIVTASSDNSAIVRDTATGQRLRTIRHSGSSVFSAVFSPDGRFIVTGSADNTAIVWNAASGQRLRTLTGHLSWVPSAAFSPDGRFIVTGSHDNTAIVWDAVSGQRLRTLSGHGPGVNAVVNSAAFSPDGRFIVTGSGDYTAIVWDAASGQRLRTLNEHSSGVNSAAYSPDGRFIVTGSDDNTAKIWSASQVVGARRDAKSPAIPPSRTVDRKDGGKPAATAETERLASLRRRWEGTWTGESHRVDHGSGVHENTQKVKLGIRITAEGKVRVDFVEFSNANRNSFSNGVTHWNSKSLRAAPDGGTGSAVSSRRNGSISGTYLLKEAWLDNEELFMEIRGTMAGEDDSFTLRMQPDLRGTQATVKGYGQTIPLHRAQ